MRKIEIIGYSYDWVPKSREETNFDNELSDKQNIKMNELFKRKFNNERDKGLTNVGSFYLKKEV